MIIITVNVLVSVRVRIRAPVRVSIAVNFRVQVRVGPVAIIWRLGARKRALHKCIGVADVVSSGRI